MWLSKSGDDMKHPSEYYAMNQWLKKDKDAEDKAKEEDYRVNRLRRELGIDRNNAKRLLQGNRHMPISQLIQHVGRTMRRR